MTEWIFIIMMVAGVGLFAAGGTGPKWARRYVLPACIAAGLIILGVSWWQSIIAGGLMILAFVLPYGSESMPSYWSKFLVGCTYVLPSLVLGFTLWTVMVPILFVTIFWLSNWDKTQDAFTWKICEGYFGFLVVTSIIAAYLNQW